MPSSRRPERASKMRSLAALLFIITAAVVGELCASSLVQESAGPRSPAVGPFTTLYGATSAGGPGELYILNASTGGMIKDIGPTNDTLSVNYPITGLAFQPATGVLYGSTGNSGSASTRSRLVSIDPATARVTVIGLFNAGPVSSGGVPTTMADIAFTQAGTLYGVSSIGGPDLYSINISTGQATLIGANGASTSTGGGGLAISSSGSAFGTPTSSRYGTYNLVTGAYTNIVTPTKPVGGAYAALAFDSSDTLYGLDLGVGTPPPTHIVKFNTPTGAVTDLGASVNALDAIAFGPVATTAANVAITGRVMDRAGRGIRGGRVTIIDSRGNTISAITNAFGYYVFNNVVSGDTYIANVASRGLIFAPRVIAVNDSLTGIDFSAK
ncbi:MAG: hypothetical protein ACJ73D_07455 [Pyrinomonadaceae bacterium]